MEERVEATRIRYVGQWLALGLMATLIAVAGSCGRAGSLPSGGEVGEGEGQPPESFVAARLPDDRAAGEESHRYYDEARRMAVRGRLEEAIILYDQALALDPSYGAAYEGRATAYHALGRHREAARDYSLAIQVREDSDLYSERGHAYLELGKYARADEDYHKAVSMGLTDPMVYMGIGDAHRLRGDLEEAGSSYSEAIRLDPGNWAAYYFRGVCNFRLRRFQQALEDFERVIVSQPHNAGAYFARGATRWLVGECTAALVDFQTFVTLSDGQETLSRARGYIDYLEAASECESPPLIPLPA